MWNRYLLRRNDNSLQKRLKGNMGTPQMKKMHGKLNATVWIEPPT